MPPRAAVLSLTRRRLHTMPLSHPIFMVWGANTSVGKTLVSASLAASSLLSPPPTFSLLPSSPSRFLYLKPLQTGFPSDSDSRFVFRKFSQIFRSRRPQLSVFASDYTLKASISAYEAVFGGGFGNLGANSGFGADLKGGFGNLGAGSGFKADLKGGFGDLGANSSFGEVLKGGFGDLGANSGFGEFSEGGFGFRDLGVYEERRLQGEGSDVADEHSELICRTIYGWREAVSPHLAAEREEAVVKDSVLLNMLKRCLEIGLEEGERKQSIMTVIETAGGVASPGPSGSLQCDLYRPLRLPAILVGDGRLGGISSTISAYESLKLRGYDVVAVVLEDNGLVNEVPLSSYLRNRVPVFVLPPIPKDMSDDLTKWFDEAQPPINSLKEVLLSSFTDRKERLQSMAKKAKDVFWWPFTQHNLVPEESVSVIDSRCGENFTVHKRLKYDLLMQQFDACASWWTQGPDQTLQIELARDMGYAAARYGHVMFPENVYEPALECAELLLEGVGKGWASRAFFSDNGSTAIEIALKMAFRKFLVDHGILTDLSKGEIAEKCIELKVLALRGSYHGDTLGAMEAQSPSSYTGLLQQPWYSGRGLFLDPPTVFMHDGVWRLTLPERMHSQSVKVDDTSFSTRDEIFNQRRDSSSLASSYFAYILQQLSLQAGLGGFTHIGALVIEPVIHGAGGMLMVDPLFQRVLVKECKNRNIPVIFDEVFTGFWRLGVESAAELLHCQPDIACYAKLMTGGIIPLSATLATSDVFDAFTGDSKLRALLHGHSYSAHAMGCTAAAKSIKWFKDTKTNANLTSDGRVLRELWDKDLVMQISSHPTVDRVVTLGTLFALELRAQGSNAGYGSLFAGSLLKNLREDGIYMRPLGNVIYLMCGPCTSPQICHQLLEKLYARLEDFGQSK